MHAARPYRRSATRERLVRRCAAPNEDWLRQWEPTPPGDWGELNSPLAFRSLLPRPAPGRPRRARRCRSRSACDRRPDGTAGRPASRSATSCGGRSAPATPATGSTRGVGRPRRHPDRARARRRPRVPLRRPAPDRGQHPAGERAVPAGGGEARLPRGGAPPALPAHRRRLARPRRVRDDRARTSPPRAACWPAGTGSATATGPLSSSYRGWRRRGTDLLVGDTP